MRLGGLVDGRPDHAVIVLGARDVRSVTPESVERRANPDLGREFRLDLCLPIRGTTRLGRRRCLDFLGLLHGCECVSRVRGVQSAIVEPPRW